MRVSATMSSKTKEEFDIVVDAETVSLTAESIRKELDPLNTGFYWYLPPLSMDDNNHTTAGHQWSISGNDMQVYTSTVPPGGTVITEVGSFMYMSPFMQTEVELTLCSGSGMSEGCNRICGGESCVKVFLKNTSSTETGYVGLTPNFPAKILPIIFGTHVKSNEPLIAQPGAYMLGDVEVGTSY